MTRDTTSSESSRPTGRPPRPTLLRISLFALYAVCFHAPLTAQVGTIQGEISDRATGAPLVNVQVFVQGAGIGALTSARGNFVLGPVHT